MAVVLLRITQTMPSSNRNGQVVTVTVAFTLVVVVLCLLTRLYMRWPWRKLMSRNDYLALLATLFAICNAAALCVAVQSGLGEKAASLSEAQTITIRRAVVTIPLQTSRAKRAHVLLGFSLSFLVIAGFIACAVVLPRDALAADFTTSRIHFEITSEITILFLIAYCTAAPLIQIGRRFQTGYNVPIIDEHHTMSGSGSGTRRINGSKNTYDMSNVTASKLAKKQYVSSVSAQDRMGWEAEQQQQRAKRDRHKSGGADGESMASDSSQKIIIRRTIEQHSNQM